MTWRLAEAHSGFDGRTFVVRLVREGDAWGRTGSRIHDEADPLVEFYDTTYAGKHPDAWPFAGHLGQFVANYYLSTLRETDWREQSGLSLHGDIPEWTVDGDSLADALDALTEEGA